MLSCNSPGTQDGVFEIGAMGPRVGRRFILPVVRFVRWIYRRCAARPALRCGLFLQRRLSQRSLYRNDCVRFEEFTHSSFSVNIGQKSDSGEPQRLATIALLAVGVLAPGAKCWMCRPALVRSMK